MLSLSGRCCRFPVLNRHYFNMPYGFKDVELQTLEEMFSSNARIEQVLLYGSRAKGNYKPFSDVDITLVGSDLSRDDVNKLYAAIDVSSLPYEFDISLYSSIRNEALLDHIHRRGIVVYRKKGEE